MSSSLTGYLYKAARLSASVHAVSTGHLTRRVSNIAKGRALAKAGVWRRLWK